MAANCVLRLTLAAQTVPEPAKELDNYVANLVAENKLSGVVLVAKDGVTVTSKAAGIANKATNAPIDLNTKFNLGSMNKMFTAVAIAQLAQAGKLSFTDTVGKQLPDYPNKEVAAKVTIHHLLTHTSGLGMYWNDKFMAQREKLLTVEAHLPLFAADPLAFPPGEKFQYSNAGYMLLGAIIEKLSGQDYYSYVQEHIYKPAGMNDTGFYEPGKEIPNLAVGYTKMGPDGQPQCLHSYKCRDGHCTVQCAGHKDCKGGEVCKVGICQKGGAVASCYENLVRNLDQIGVAYGRQGAAQRHARGVRNRLEHSHMDDIFQRGLHEFIGEFIADNNRLGEIIGKQYLI